MKRIIGVVGPAQSGSTLLYNIIKTMFEISGESYVLGRQNYGSKKENLLCKTHKYDPILQKKATHLFLTLRDLRDIVSSARKKYKKYYNLLGISKRAELNIGFFNIWKPHASYIFKYETYMSDKNQVIQEIADILGYQITSENIRFIIKNVEIGYEKSKFNIFGGRISHYYDNLTTEEVDHLNKKFHDFLEEHKYLDSGNNISTSEPN